MTASTLSHSAITPTLSERARIFDRVFNAATTQQLTYNAEWNNNTGYFDHLVFDDVIAGDIGSIGAFTTPAPNGRRVLALKTRYGNIVIFDRYTPGHGPQVLVYNMPREIEELLRPGRPLTDDDMYRLFGQFESKHNFATALESLTSMPKDEQFKSPWEIRAAKVRTK